MTEKMKWLENYTPLGIDVGKQVGWWLAGVVAATLHSMLFLIRYFDRRADLYILKAGKRVLIDGAVMTDFGTLTEGVFLTFYLVSIVTLLVIIYHYFYHYQGSKMMYLMKRLPDKWELHRRCITLPVVGAVLMMVWMLVVHMLYYTIYILCTPSQCLPL